MYLCDIIDYPRVGGVTSGAIGAEKLLVQIYMARTAFIGGLCKNQLIVAHATIDLSVLPLKTEACLSVVKWVLSWINFPA